MATDEEFIKAAYELILSRTPGDDEVGSWAGHMRVNGLSRQEVVTSFVNSQEFLNLYLTRGRVAEFWEGLHRVRVDMMKWLLPSGDSVLDIGGASPADPRGALLNCGYPHLPKRLSIVDLPPDIRMLESAEKTQTVIHGLCEIMYYYRSMTDLGCFEDGSFDFIWSGQSIEHVTRDEAEMIISQAKRLLRPGGSFALDTPNRRVTALQVPWPHSYIHPEHKYEYRYEELAEALERCGFRIVEAKGLVEMRQSVRQSRFLLDEFFGNLSINDNPADSYLFYIRCTPGP